MRLLTIAALLTTAATLQGCTHEEHAHSEAIFTALGAPLPAGLAKEEPVNETPEIEQVVPDVSPPVVAPPPPPPNEYEVWQNDPTYVCEPVFRVKSCTDDGEPVWLDNQMGWLPFGVVP